MLPIAGSAGEIGITGLEKVAVTTMVLYTATAVRDKAVSERLNFLNRLTVAESRVVVHAIAIYHGVTVEVQADDLEAPPADTRVVPGTR